MAVWGAEYGGFSVKKWGFVNKKQSFFGGKNDIFLRF